MRFWAAVIFWTLVHSAMAANPIIVNTSSDTVDASDGFCSLREAITASNDNVASGNTEGECLAGQPYDGSDTTIDAVLFDIPDGGGVVTIQPTTALPVIMEPAQIIGVTQTGASCSGWPYSLVVELDGSLLSGSEDGLVVGASAPNTMLTGLVINRFPGSGIVLNGADDAWIFCNYIGTDPGGTIDRGNGNKGVLVQGGADRVVIGTNGDGAGDAGEGNLISGQGTSSGVPSGISLVSGSGVRVSGNRIGTDVTGTLDLGNLGRGIEILPAASNSIIGTDGDGTSDDLEGNLISGNDNNGIRVDSSFHRFSGNIIGGTIDGDCGDPEVRNGIGGFAINNSSNLLIGYDGTGLWTAERNRVACESQAGIVVFGTSTDITIRNNEIEQNDRGIAISGNAEGVTITENSISANAKLGIDLVAGGDPASLVTPNDLGDADVGPNQLQNYPVITKAMGGEGVWVIGTLNSLADTTFIIEFFESPACDSSGYGEGERSVGAVEVTTDGSGNASFLAGLEMGFEAGQDIPVVTATATDPQGNTSEFSACVTALLDTDLDRVPDIDELDEDTDGDGTFNVEDPDDDGDGVPTIEEDPDGDGDPTNDNSDGDGLPNYLDPDDDGDGYLTKDEDDGDGDPTNDDSDEDSIPDYLDEDSDDDGVADADELNENSDASCTTECQPDDLPNRIDSDDDGDNVATYFESPDGDDDPLNDNTDGDSAPDYLDPDDDGDGVPTLHETYDDSSPLNDDTDDDTTPDYLDIDDDGDGVLTADEDYDGNGDPRTDNSDAGCTIECTADATPDYLDTDDDGDGVPTLDESPDGDGDPLNDDTDDDTTPDYLDTDDDGDGVPTANEDYDGNGDPTTDNSDAGCIDRCSADEIPDYLDTDDDGDGVLTIDEDRNGDGDPTNDDFDGDETPDYLDPDPIPDTVFVNSFESFPRLVFVTSTAYNGDLMTAGGGTTGPEGADNLCNQHAQAAGLPGTYTAWVSVAAEYARDRISGIGGPYYLPDEAGEFAEQVASDLGDLLACEGVFPKECLDGPINRDENGQILNTSVWTGTRETGTVFGADTTTTCQAWTDGVGDGSGVNNSGAEGRGRYGSSGQSNSLWTSNQFVGCQRQLPLYCFQD